jgi:hypothetical protein
LWAMRASVRALENDPQAARTPPPPKGV